MFVGSERANSGHCGDIISLKRPAEQKHVCRWYLPHCSFPGVIAVNFDLQSLEVEVGLEEKPCHSHGAAAGAGVWEREI